MFTAEQPADGLRSTDHIRLTEAMWQLSEPELKVVMMRFWHNFSIEEISRTLLLSWTSVDAILTEILKKLRFLYVIDGRNAVLTEDEAA